MADLEAVLQGKLCLLNRQDTQQLELLCSTSGAGPEGEGPGYCCAHSSPAVGTAAATPAQTCSGSSGTACDQVENVLCSASGAGAEDEGPRGCRAHARAAGRVGTAAGGCRCQDCPGVRSHISLLLRESRIQA